MERRRRRRAARASPHIIRAPDEPLKLSGAQLVIAREHGFASWPRLRAYVDRVTAHGPGLQHAYHEDLEYYDDRAVRAAGLGRGRDRRARSPPSAATTRR